MKKRWEFLKTAKLPPKPAILVLGKAGPTVPALLKLLPPLQALAAILLNAPAAKPLQNLPPDITVTPPWNVPCATAENAAREKKLLNKLEEAVPIP